MGAGSLIALLLDEDFGLLVGGLACLGGTIAIASHRIASHRIAIAIAIAVARLAEAVQYLAMRERRRDREHADN